MITTRVLTPLLVLLGSAIASSAGETIRLRADTWMPFNGGTGDTPGYVIDVMNAVFAPKGVAVEYENMPWDKSLAACKAGEVDAVACANLKEAAGLTVGAETISEIKYCVYTLKGSTWTLQGEHSFKGHKMGVAEGYSYWENLDRFIAANKEALVMLNPDDVCWDGLQKLQSGEIELLPECPQVFYWRVKEHKLDPAQFRTACRMSGDPVYVAFRPDEQGRAWAKVLDEGIRELRASGKLAAILAKYGLTDWKS